MSNLITPPRAIFRQIQANLKDRYGSGFPVLKELIQNAEDASAHIIRFIAHDGWPDAENPLLRLRGLLVANDGIFLQKDARGILSFADSAKGDDTAAIGRFGFGQKAVFHLCDAFIAHAFGEDNHPFSEVINPCLDVIPETKAASWDTIGSNDLALLTAEIADIRKGFLIWLPLRHDSILPAPKLFFTDYRATLDDLISELQTHESDLRLILASLRNLDRIEVEKDGETRFSLDREGGSTRMIGPDVYGDGESRRFSGKVADAIGSSVTYVGRETYSHNHKLAELKSSETWPQVPVFTDQGEDMRPEKAEAHGAVVVANGLGETNSTTVFEWGVFLPIAEATRLNTPNIDLRVLLHGYFFVDSGRRYIEGFDGDSKESRSVYHQWNETLRDELVLPQLPSALFDALQSKMVTGKQLAEFLSSLSSSHFGQTHAAAVARKQCLIRKLEPKGEQATAAWALIPADTELRPLPSPDDRSRVDTAEILPGLNDWAAERNLVLLAGPEAALTLSRPEWHADEIADLLVALSMAAFQRGRRADVLAKFLRTAVGYKETLREAAAPPLLAALRHALSEQETLATQDQLREVLSHLPPDTVVALPPSASERRDILRALAEVEATPLCLHAEWVTESARLTEIKLYEAAPLLAALEPLLSQDRNADAAGTAALALVKLLRRYLRETLDDPKISTLLILRAGDGSGLPKLVSLSELSQSARDRRLFKSSPNVQQALKLMSEAVPNSGALVVGGDAARLLEEIGSPFSFTEGKKENFAALVLRTDEFGDAEARAKALEAIVTQSPEARRGLRTLAVGDKRAANDSARIFALSQAAGRLDELALKLIEESETDFLIPNAVLDVLKQAEQRSLGIEPMDGPSLGKLLSSKVEVISQMTLDDGIIAALLESDVPDEDLRSLPVFPTEGGLRVPADEIWRSSSSWHVPGALASFVQILKPLHSRKATERLERLVRQWSPEAQIETALAQSQPQEFVTEILNALEHATESLAHRLRDAKWVPDNQGLPWKPSDVLELPEEVLEAARIVLGNGEDAAFVQLSDVRREVRDHPGFEKLRREKVLPGQSESVDALLIMIDAAAPLARFGEVQEQDAKAIRQLAEQGADLALPGWPLLSALIRQTEKNPSELARHFGVVTENDLSKAVDHANTLAKLANYGKKKAARALYDSIFRALCSWRSEALFEAMGRIHVPVQTGGWETGSQVAARVQGIAPAHRLDETLDQYWPKPHIELSDQSLRDEEAETARSLLEELSKEEKNCANSLVPLLKHAQAGVPPQLLAFLVGVVRRSEPFRNLVRRELGLSETIIDQVWGRIDHILETASVHKTVLINFRHVESHERVKLTSLSNESVLLPVGGLEPLLVVGNQHRKTTVVHQGGIYNYKTLDIAALDQPVDAKHVLSLLQTVLSECTAYPSGAIEKLNQIADDYKEIEQTTVKDAQARLEDRLPQILAELKPRRGTTLREALDDYENKEQRLPPGRERELQLPSFKRELWKRIRSPGVSEQLLAAVRKQIEDYGYSPDRVLFELFQNADDASEQHEPPGHARFRLEVSDTHLRALHWGRLINHAGPDPDKGEREGWLRDLFNMLLMNLSEKREGVTGRFGLGFKSVHLIADEVGIASGFVACKVQGGMLPEAWEDGRQLSFEQEDHGRRATAIQLSIDEDREEAALAAVNAFSETGRWLPAMARCVRSIELDGAVSREWRAEYRPLSAGIDVVDLTGSEPGRSLALKLGEDTTLFLPLSSDGPIPAKKELSRLWLLAPLAETLKSGWLMNGRKFQVDPGRGSLKRGDGEPQATLERLGLALGEKLIALADLIDDDWSEFASSAGLSDHSPETGPVTFWTRLAELFALDPDDELARHLHSPERGYGRLVAERAVFPSFLPRPFKALLRASEVQHSMHGMLSEPSLVADLRDWSSLDELAASCVAQRAADQLQKLGFSRAPTITLPVIVRQEIGSERRIDPILGQRLGRVLSKDRLDELDGHEEKHLLEVLSKSRFLMADETWREARYSPRKASDADEEENRILSFAPDKAVADNAYKGEALRLYRLAMRQSGFQRTAETFSHWAKAISNDARKTALLEYVLDGRQGTETGKKLAKTKPGWLPTQADELRKSALVSDIPDDELPRLLGLLYPDEQRKRWEWNFVDDPTEPGPEETESQIDTFEFLKAIHSWWKREHHEERQRAKNHTYPEFFSLERLQDTTAEDDREAWFTFFALGIFRTIGRTVDSQHRSFVAAAHRNGWWGEMASAQLPSDPEPWVRQLEDMAHANAWRIDFPQWRRSLSDLYVLARWLPDYIDAFRTLPSVVRQNDHVALSDAWRLSSSPVWQRRGLEGAPLSQSLGLGANWMIREAIRHRIWTPENAVVMHPYGWASTARVRRLFGSYLGESLGEFGDMDLSPRIHKLVQDHLGNDADFLGDLDLPLQIVADERRSDTLQAVLSDLGNAIAFSEEYIDDEEAYG